MVRPHEVDSVIVVTFSKKHGGGGRGRVHNINHPGKVGGDLNFSKDALALFCKGTDACLPENLAPLVRL